MEVKDMIRLFFILLLPVFLFGQGVVDISIKGYSDGKKENPQTYLFSKSPDKWKNSFLVAIGDESEKAKYRNHYWEFDATPADPRHWAHEVQADEDWGDSGELED